MVLTLFSPLETVLQLYTRAYLLFSFESALTAGGCATQVSLCFSPLPVATTVALLILFISALTAGVYAACAALCFLGDPAVTAVALLFFDC